MTDGRVNGFRELTFRGLYGQTIEEKETAANMTAVTGEANAAGKIVATAGASRPADEIMDFRNGYRQGKYVVRRFTSGTRSGRPGKTSRRPTDVRPGRVDTYRISNSSPATDIERTIVHIHLMTTTARIVIAGR
jgi:hypothetical protein